MGNCIYSSNDEASSNPTSVYTSIATKTTRDEEQPRCSLVNLNSMNIDKLHLEASSFDKTPLRIDHQNNFVSDKNLNAQTTQSLNSAKKDTNTERASSKSKVLSAITNYCFQ